MAERIEREEVVEAFKALVLETGAKDPARLPNTPQVRRANELFGLWQTQEDGLVGDDMAAELRLRVAKNMLFVEAGFDDPNYLGEVADWLGQDKQDAKMSVPEEKLPNLLEEINAAIARVGGTEDEEEADREEAADAEGGYNS